MNINVTNQMRTLICEGITRNIFNILGNEDENDKNVAKDRHANDQKIGGSKPIAFCEILQQTTGDFLGGTGKSYKLVRFLVIFTK